LNDLCSGFSAKGAKCKSLGHRPREMRARVTALKARNIPGEKVLSALHNGYDGDWLCRAFSAFYFEPDRSWGDAPGSSISRPWRSVELSDSN
jgi:hypothetical protein